MAKDGLKNRVRFSTTLNPKIEMALKEYSINTGIPISKIVDRALLKYLELDVEKNSGGVQ